MLKSSRYPDQFTREAVELVRIVGRAIRQIVDELGVADQTLRNWINADEAARGGGEMLAENEREELKFLRMENKRQRMEREILKSRGGFYRSPQHLNFGGADGQNRRVLSITRWQNRSSPPSRTNASTGLYTPPKPRQGET